MTRIEVEANPLLSAISTTLYSQMCAFGLLGTDWPRPLDPAGNFLDQAAVAVDWLTFLDTRTRAHFSADSAYLIAAGLEPVGAGVIADDGPSVGEIARYRLGTWTRHPETERAADRGANLVRGALRVAQVRGVEAAMSWVRDLALDGWLESWCDAAVCLATLLNVDDTTLPMLPDPGDSRAWERLDVNAVVDDHLDTHDLHPLVSHNGASATQADPDRQRAVLALAQQHLESVRAAASLDDWVLGVTASQILSAASRRQLAQVPTGPLSIRHQARELEEIIADSYSASAAALDQPTWSNRWSHACSVADQLRAKVGDRARDEIVERRLLVPRAIASAVLAGDELPPQWRTLSPAVALPWGALRGWEARFANPEDYAPTFPAAAHEAIRDDDIGRRRIRVNLVRMTRSETLRRIETGDVSNLDAALEMAMLEAPYADELFSAAAFLASHKGDRVHAILLGMTSVVAWPADPGRWFDFARILDAQGLATDSAALLAFLDSRDWIT